MLERARHCLSGLMKDSPVEVYAIALDLLRDKHNPLPEGIDEGVKDMARLAARNSLLDPQLGFWNAEMYIKSGDYAWFTGYHRRCSVRLLQFLTTEDLIKVTGSEWIWYNTRCGVCPRATPGNVSVLVPTVKGNPKYPVTWWVDYWELVISVTGERPCEESFKDEQIWGSTLRTLAGQCPKCYSAAMEEYPRFSRMVVQRITEIVNSEEVSCIPLSTDQCPTNNHRRHPKGSHSAVIPSGKSCFCLI